MGIYKDAVKGLGPLKLTPSNLISVMRRIYTGLSEPDPCLSYECDYLLRLIAEADIEMAAAAAAALHICIQSTAEYPHQDSLSHVLAGLLLNHSGERLGEAVRRPGMMAAAAAWDPHAVPALCILTLAGDDMTPDLQRTPSRRPRQLLQPATLECVRYIAGGGAPPLLRPRDAALYAGLLAEEYCEDRSLDDEATVVQLLQDCSAMLAADVRAAPALLADWAAAEAAEASSSRAEGGRQPDGQLPSEQHGCEGPDQSPEAPMGAEEMGWQSVWCRSVALDLQALVRIQRDTLAARLPAGGGDQRSHEQPPADPSPAAAAACAAGVQALLAHEAVLERGDVGSMRQLQDALLAPMQLGQAAAGVQQALVSGLMDATRAVLALFPADCGTRPTASQAAALCRLAQLAAGATRLDVEHSCRLFDETEQWRSWATMLAAASTVLAHLARQASCRSAAGQHGCAGCSTGRKNRSAAGGSTPANGEALRRLLRGSQQQRERRQRRQRQQQRHVWEAAFHLAEAAVLLLPPAATADLGTLEQEPAIHLLTGLAGHCRIDSEALELHVQARAEREPSEERIRRDCMADLVRVAAVLEAAVTMVAAAAEKPAGPQPSDSLKAACCIVVDALLGLALLQFKHFGCLATHQSDGMAEVLQAIQSRAELAARLVRGCGAFVAEALLGGLVVHKLLVHARTAANLLSSAAPALQPLLATLRASAKILLTLRRPGVEHPPCSLRWATAAIENWEQLISNIQQEVRKEKSPKGRLIMKALEEFSGALTAFTAARAAECPAYVAEMGAVASPVHMQAASDAAMQELLAAEDSQEALAAAPSKAAEKRARKKAAARAAAAAAAAAVPRPNAGLLEGGQPSSATAAGAASNGSALASADAANTLQGMGLAEDAAIPTGPSASSVLEQHSKNDTADPQQQWQQRQQQQPQPQQQSPAWMLCTITKEVMAQPVLCVGDGHSYEQAAITAWLQAHSTSPVTGPPLATTDLLPNHALRQLIQAAGPRQGAAA